MHAHDSHRSCTSPRLGCQTPVLQPFFELGHCQYDAIFMNGSNLRMAKIFKGLVKDVSVDAQFICQMPLAGARILSTMHLAIHGAFGMCFNPSGASRGSPGQRCSQSHLV